MSLVINHNMMAMNSTRNLNETYGRLATSTRRLSSGLRVGTAADDAAGLAMRELMRADIATLGQGLRNANDGISMIQTADGALGVIDAKLVRMKELAEQAATGTYTDVQRKLIDQEYQLMADEITRIAQDTDFNSRKLLAGTGMDIKVEQSASSKKEQIAMGLQKLEANVETWNVTGTLAKPADTITGVAGTETTDSASGVVTIRNTAAGGSGAVAPVGTFGHTTESGLAVSTVITGDSSGAADGDYSKITFNPKTGVITAEQTDGATTTNDAPTVASTFATKTYGDAGAATPVTVTEFSYELTSTTVTTPPTPPVWDASVTNQNASGVAGTGIRVTMTLSDGRTITETITNNTGGTFNLTKDTTNGTLEFSMTGTSTTAMLAESKIGATKEFTYTSKTDASVRNEVTITDPSQPNANTLTHNIKDGTININSGAQIESFASGTYGKTDFEPKRVFVEVLNKVTGEWEGLAVNPDPSLDIPADSENFRITADYGHGKIRRDTFSNNKDGHFTLTKTAHGYELGSTDLKPGTGEEFQGSSTQISVKSEDMVVVNIHFGSSNELTDNYDTEIEQASAKSLGVGKLAGDSIDTQDNAKKALDNLTVAIRRKDAIRAQIGSTQNRLSATIENVAIQQENLQASESRISDVDVATEMTEFNRNQILTNAAVSMLAQANSLPKMAQKLLDAK